VSESGPGEGGPPADDDACWREAARLRGEHVRWVVIWLSSAREFRAYRRMPGARRDTILAAPTAGELAAQIVRAEPASSQGAPDAGRQS
jgi:hypothetical protein